MAETTVKLCRNGLHEMTEENSYYHPNGIYVRCRQCGRDREIERQIRDRDKRARYARDRYRENKEEINHRRRLRNHGLTQEQYDALGASCALCGCLDNTPEAGQHNRLHIDHNHETGVVRGLLCHHHNLMIGLAKDDPDMLISGAFYLMRGGI